MVYDDANRHERGTSTKDLVAKLRQFHHYEAAQRLEDLDAALAKFHA